MKCSRVRDKLMDYTSADLPPSELQRINEHLMGCEECRAALDLSRRASSALDMLGSEEPTPALASAVRERISQDRSVGRPVLLPRLAIGFSATALAALIITGWMRFGSVEPKNIAVKPTIDTRTQTDVKPTPVPTSPSPASKVKANSGPTIAVNHSENAAVSAEHRRRPAGRIGGQPKAPEQSPDRSDEWVAPETPIVGPDADSEPVILIAVQPKEPEIYMMHLDYDEEEPATELTVVREFDGGGNITSVTIRGESSADSPNDGVAPAVDRTQLLDVPSANDVQAGYPYAEGSAGNA